MGKKNNSGEATGAYRQALAVLATDGSGYKWHTVHINRDGGREREVAREGDHCTYLVLLAFLALRGALHAIQDT